MKTCEWTPKSRNRFLGLMQGGRHSLPEISNITNIPKSTLGDLKKRGTPLNKARSGHPHKLSERDKRHIELLIRRNHTTHRLSARAVINTLGLNVGLTTVKLALEDLGYRQCIARRRPFLKKK